jgi:putative ABC transport system permease protein
VELGPILRSMRHHKGAFSLLVLEVAFGFVILVHALIYARYYRNFGAAAPGVPTEELIVVDRRFLHPRLPDRARAEQRADLAALARLGGLGVAAVDTVPLPDTATFPMVMRASGGDHVAIAWTTRVTAGVLDALGLKLVTGRGFAAAGDRASDGGRPLIISRRLANDLFDLPESALGRVLEGPSGDRGTVVGVVENFALLGTGAPNWGSVAIALDEPVTEHRVVYVLRAPADRRAALVEAARRVLEANATSAADALTVVRPFVFGDVRFARISRGAVLVLSWTGFLVVAVALAGSLALSSFSVTERTRQIGIRRALGARRGEIVAYFLLENLLLTTLGLLVGIVLAYALNRALVLAISDVVLQLDLVLLSAGIFLGTGLLSALVPARRAAAIPPWAATRTL